MSENLSESFVKAVSEIVTRKTGDDVKKIIDITTETRDDGLCETCSYTYAVIVVEYRDAADKWRQWDYRGSFLELIRELTD